MKIRLFTFGEKNAILSFMGEKLKIFSFLPTIFMLCIIFSFSGQKGDVSSQLSHSITYKIVELEGKIIKEKFDNNTVEQKVKEIHFFVRKIGHVTEFFLLGLAMTIPCFVYQIKGKKFIFIPIVCATICAGLDEFHQIFVPGREAALRDVFIDSTGIIFAVFCVQIGKKLFLSLREKWIGNMYGKDS